MNDTQWNISSAQGTHENLVRSPLGPTSEQWRSFRARKFLAMPIAGALAWSLIGVLNLWVFESTFARSMTIYAGTGMILYLGMLVARLTGEDLMGRQDPGNPFDRLFLGATAQAVFVYAIAIPFAIEKPDSLPLSVGILTGLMWIPFSTLVQHWVGYFHTISRTILILVLWYAWPEARFYSIPAAVVAVYLLTIGFLWLRYQSLQQVGNVV